MSLATHKRGALPAIAAPPAHAHVRGVATEPPPPFRRVRAAGRTTTPLRLLLIEDSDDDAAVIVNGLTRSGYDVQPERVRTLEELARALKRQPWELAISRLSLRALNGLSALKLVRRYDAQLPFIFMGEAISVDTAVDAIKRGAQDCIVSGDLGRLAPIVKRELRAAVDRTSRARADARRVQLAYRDGLTDLPNGLLLNDRLRQAMAGAERAHEPLAVIILDLDQFQGINDVFGRYAGDSALQHVAARLRGLLREMDTVARLGGDQFAIVLPRTDVSGARNVAARILEGLNPPACLNGRPFPVAASLGIAAFPAHGSNADALLKHAGLAMLVAKSRTLGYAVYKPSSERTYPRAVAARQRI